MTREIRSKDNQVTIFLLLTERKSNSQICPARTVGVWRHCTRLSDWTDVMRALSQVGFCCLADLVFLRKFDRNFNKWTNILHAQILRFEQRNSSDAVDSVLMNYNITEKPNRNVKNRTEPTYSSNRPNFGFHLFLKLFKTFFKTSFKTFFKTFFKSFF